MRGDNSDQSALRWWSLSVSVSLLCVPVGRGRFFFSGKMHVARSPPDGRMVRTTDRGSWLLDDHYRPNEDAVLCQIYPNYKDEMYMPPPTYRAKTPPVLSKEAQMLYPRPSATSGRSACGMMSPGLFSSGKQVVGIAPSKTLKRDPKEWQELARPKLRRSLSTPMDMTMAKPASFGTTRDYSGFISMLHKKPDPLGTKSAVPMYACQVSLTAD